MKLYAPKEYWEATPEQIANICNGCGSKDGVKVPNTMWGLSIKEACFRHDFMYYLGKTRGDKFFSDAMFMMNLAVLIINSSNWFTVMPRLFRATKYYIAVVKYGKDAYWVNKEPNEEMTITLRGEFR